MIRASAKPTVKLLTVNCIWINALRLELNKTAWNGIKLNVRKRDMPLLDFLKECERTGLDKRILDCGAGGSRPPLAIFHGNAYDSHGIEISAARIDEARQYAKLHGMDLKIVQGDMRKLPYQNSSFSFAFSHHTIHHMKKVDIKVALSEMIRVLVLGGILFVNVPTVDSADHGNGVEIARGEFQEIINGKEVIHSYFEEDEADSYFSDLEIIKKQKREFRGRVMLDYIARKPRELD